MSIMKPLADVRAELKLPKTEFNPIQGYNFRNAEAMCAVIKPVCRKYGLTFWFTDDVVNVGVHNYVKTTLTVAVIDGDETCSVSAFAREDDLQTMPASPMITGSASSYAHKYALQAMFAVDDGAMDPDAMTSGNPVQTAVRNPIPVQGQTPSAGTFVPAGNVPIPNAGIPVQNGNGRPANGATPPLQTAGRQVQAKPVNGATPPLPTAGRQIQAKPANGSTPPLPTAGTHTQVKPANGTTPPLPTAGTQVQAKPANGTTPPLPTAGTQTQVKPANGTTPPLPTAGGQVQAKPANGSTPPLPTAGTQTQTKPADVSGLPIPNAGIPNAGSAPIFGEAPSFPDFSQGDVSGPTFPWEDDGFDDSDECLPWEQDSATKVPEFKVNIPTGIPLPTDAQKATEANGVPTVYGVSYDPARGALVETDRGTFCYKAFEGEWVSPSGTEGSVDLDGLFKAASEKIGKPLDQYAGVFEP